MFGETVMHVVRGGGRPSPLWRSAVLYQAKKISDVFLFEKTDLATEVTYIRKDGSRFTALVSVTALRDAHTPCARLFRKSPPSSMASPTRRRIVLGIEIGEGLDAVMLDQHQFGRCSTTCCSTL